MLHLFLINSHICWRKHDTDNESYQNVVKDFMLISILSVVQLKNICTKTTCSYFDTIQ